MNVKENVAKLDVDGQSHNQDSVLALHSLPIHHHYELTVL